MKLKIICWALVLVATAAGAQQATTTSIGASNFQANTHQQVTLTAIVRPYVGTTGSSPTGVVTFLDQWN
jgi:hypothetical protein